MYLLNSKVSGNLGAKIIGITREGNTFESAEYDHLSRIASSWANDFPDIQQEFPKHLRRNLVGAPRPAKTIYHKFF